MKILGIDSSGLVAGIAVVEDGKLLAEYSTNYKKTHSQTLMPMLEQVKAMIDLELDSIDAIAIAAGPGSFTGLRIGAATAKGLGLALKKPLVEVPTLMGMAYNLYGCPGNIVPMMDARRNQVYTGIYAFQREENMHGFDLKTVMEQTAMDVKELIDKVNALGETAVFLGDGVDAYKSVIEAECKVPFTYAAPGSFYQRAGSVASLGELFAKEGKVIDAALHQPEYLRKSQAEREKEEGKGPTAKHDAN